MSSPLRLFAIVAIAVAVIGFAWAGLQAAPSGAGVLAGDVNPMSASAQAPSTSPLPTSMSPTSTTRPDPDLGRRLVVRPPESTGSVIQGGPLWIGVVVALSGAAGIAYALVTRVPRRRAQSWPKRRRP